MDFCDFFVLLFGHHLPALGVEQPPSNGTKMGGEGGRQSNDS